MVKKKPTDGVSCYHSHMNSTSLSIGFKNSLLAYGEHSLVGSRGEYFPIGKRSRNLLRKLDSFELPIKNSQFDQVFLFSDPHFDHDNIVNLCSRPFNSGEEMRISLLENLKVTKEMNSNGIFICLGDLAIKKGQEWHEKLMDILGEYILIVGNHDAKSANESYWIDKNAKSCGVLTIEKTGLLQHLENPGVYDEFHALPDKIHLGLSHWPIPNEMLPNTCWASIHGHVHNSPSRPRKINVSMENINYQPISLSNLLTPFFLSNFLT